MNITSLIKEWRKKIMSMTIDNSVVGGKVTVNGKVYDGNNVTIKGSRIYIDGRLAECDEREITIIVNGNANNIVSGSGNVTVKGDVTGGFSTVSGDATVEKNVYGSVRTVSGDIEVGGAIAGDAKTLSGDIYK